MNNIATSPKSSDNKFKTLTLRIQRKQDGEILCYYQDFINRFKQFQNECKNPSHELKNMNCVINSIDGYTYFLFINTSLYNLHLIEKSLHDIIFGVKIDANCDIHYTFTRGEVVDF